LISIVIPSYNRTGHLQNLVDSIIRQSVKPLEVLIIDQNTYDLSEKIRNGGNIDIRILKQKSPNVSLARNHGALKAKGDYVLFLDDDIVLEDHDFIRKASEFIIEYPNIKCLCPYIEQEDFEQARLFYEYPGNFPDGKGDGNTPYRIIEAGSLAILFDKAYFKKTGGFDPHLFDFAGTSEDQELFFRMNDLQLPVYAFPGMVVFHDHEASGGCELRTADYWKTREKCTRSWVYMKWIKNRNRHTLTIKDLLDLMRSSFLNGELTKGNLSSAIRNLKILKRAITDGKGVFNSNRQHYLSNKINHLATEL